MRSTRQLSVTLPNKMAEMVSRKVASGEYASESEVIRDGLRALQARDRVLEDWLRNRAVPAYDAFDPERAVSAKSVRKTLARAHKRTIKIRG